MKEKCFAEFQFLIGSLESKILANSSIVQFGFQFLIGSLESMSDTG